MALCPSTAAGLTASMIEPAIAEFLAAWLLHERLSNGEIVGCLLMIVAILVLMRGESAGQGRDSTAGRGRGDTAGKAAAMG